MIKKGKKNKENSPKVCKNDCYMVEKKKVQQKKKKKKQLNGIK